MKHPYLNSWNPFDCSQTILPFNILLMCKLIVLGLWFKGYWYEFSDHFLPFWPIFDYLGPPDIFQRILQSLFIIGSVMLLFNRAVRSACLILALVFLITVASSKIMYSNVKFFCGCIFLLTALYKPAENAIALLRYQIIIVYLGSWVNKIFDDDWRSGQYFEYWMGAIIKRETYVYWTTLFPPMLLSKFFCWSAIITEIWLTIALLTKLLRGLAMWTGIYFHCLMFLVAWYDFKVFMIAILSSYLIFIAWPKDIQRRGLFAVKIDGQNYTGFLAFKKNILYSPAFYFIAVGILGLPHEEFLWIKLQAVKAALVFFFPLPEILHYWQQRRREESSPVPSIILFDGVCNLCSGSVNFVIRRDPQAKFQFAALQSGPGQILLKNFNLPTDEFNTFILIEADHYYQRSTAALRVLKNLNGLWPLLYALVLVPRPIRDFFYQIIARNRYRWFGKRDQCLMPTPDLQKRFLLPIDD